MGQTMGLQVLEVVCDQSVSKGVPVAIRLQLGHETLAHVHGTTANRVKLHQLLTGGLDGFWRAVYGGGYVVNRDREPAVLVEITNDLAGSSLLRLADVQQVDLPLQVL